MRVEEFNSLLERGNKNIKYFSPPSGNRTTSRLVLLGTNVHLRKNNISARYSTKKNVNNIANRKKIKNYTKHILNVVYRDRNTSKWNATKF